MQTSGYLGYGDLWLLGKIGVLPPVRHYWRGVLFIVVMRVWTELMMDWWIRPFLKRRGYLPKTNDERTREFLQALNHHSRQA
jgi:hypothetical protein